MDRVPLWRRFRSAQQIRDEVDEEIAFHLEQRIRELEAEGFAPAQAREEALRRFGDMRETWSVCVESDRRRERRAERREIMTEARKDIVVALRQIRSRPGFALVAAATLAVGIGATTALFSAADHVLLRPLPYRDAERVVTLWETDQESGERKREVSPGNFLDWRGRSEAFSAIALAEPYGVDLTDRTPPEPVETWLVSEGWFEALGVVPSLGRGFLPEEHRSGERVLVISDRLWKSRFAGDPAVIGRVVEVDGDPATIVGIIPPGLDYPAGGDIWAPKVWQIGGTGYDESQERSASYMITAARLEDGVTLAQAQRDMDRVAMEVAGEHPATNQGVGVNVVPLREHIVGDVRPALLVLLGAVAFVLLIACANVASLLLARGAERERELAVRAALGAGRGRLVRQLVTESLVLAGAGGVLGAAVAWGGVRLFKGLAPSDLPRLSALAVDGRVLLFAAGVTILTALLFGLAPAIRFSRPDLLSPLRTGTRGGASPVQQRLRRALVVAEIALALVLLVGAGLLGRSFAALVSNDLGFRPEGVAAVQMFLWDRNPTGAQRLAVAGEMLGRFRALPGVEDAALTTAVPFHPHMIDAQDALRVEGRATAVGEGRTIVYTTVTSPGYFRVMGVPLLAGRDFTERDRLDAPRVAIVNRALARRFFPDGDPIGERVTVGVMSAPYTWEIVGVVDDVRPTALDAEPRPELYVPFAQSLTGSVTLVARAPGGAAAALPALRQAVWDLDPAQSIYHSSTMEALIRSTLVTRRFNLALIAGLGGVALVLASIGIYGLLSFTTALRSGEIGIRMALGAHRSDVLRLVLRDGVLLAVAGVALGGAGALLLTRFLAGMLYDVRPTDPLTFAAVSLAMLAVAATATFIPARRAAGADPMRALREE